MNCEHVVALISARLDGEIAPVDLAVLEAHLTECPSCAATAEAFALQDSDLRRVFVERRTAARAVAQEAIGNLPVQTPAATRAPKPMRKWPRAALGVASLAAVVLVTIGLAIVLRPPRSLRTVPSAVVEVLQGLSAQPLVPSLAPKRLAVGDTLRTQAGERRRVALPDNSVLYVNQNTSVTLAQGRRLTLSSGEVFLEVTPADHGVDPLVVQTPQRDVMAVGTRLAVQADAARTGVMVTQGYALATGYEGVIPAGWQLSAEDGSVTPAPRASYLLDWTRDLMAEADSPLVPGSQYEGGALVAVDPYGQEAKLALRKYHIDVHVEDGFARTTIDQTYFNHANSRLEGTFYFPLPPDASLSRLAMYVDGNLMEGGMVERDYGRQVYEKIVWSKRDPALLEWVDGSTFKMRVFPLEARQEKRIVLSYTQRLSNDYGREQYRFPGGHTLETVRDWSFHTLVKGGAAYGWSSPSHPEMRAEQIDGDLLLDVRTHDADLKRDVVLSLLPQIPRVGNGANGTFSSADHEGARYLMVRYRPTVAAPLSVKPRDPRDWVILFESSGDRDPLLARTQIEILRSLLNNAEQEDTFVVLTAGTQTHLFANEAKPLTPENITTAIAYLEKSHLIGALDLSRALGEAAPFLKAAKNPYLVHLGSGVAAMGERRDDILAQQVPAGTHYVGVGVGKKWNRNFMKIAAERSGGYFTQINPDECVPWRGFELSAALTKPRLLDVKVSDDAGRPWQTFVNSLSDGEELCAVARYDDAAPLPASVKVIFSYDGQPTERVLPVRDLTTAGHLPRTWAKLEIERLLAEDAAKHREQVIGLSKAMYVMTPYTSLLVLENEAMYAEHKVDRGRKDHWAMYPCPAKIPIVYEPDPNSPYDPSKTPGQKPNEQQVLQTILVRVPPRCLNAPGEPGGNSNAVVRAIELYSGAYALPESRESRSGLRDTDDDLKDVEFGVEPGLDRPALFARSEILGFIRLGELGVGERDRNLPRLLLRDERAKRSKFEPKLLSGAFQDPGQINFFETFAERRGDGLDGRVRLLSLDSTAFSPDGRVLTRGGLGESKVRLWNTSSGSSTTPDVHFTEGFDSIAVDFAYPESSRVVTYTDGTGKKLKKRVPYTVTKAVVGNGRYMTLLPARKQLNDALDADEQRAAIKELEEGREAGLSRLSGPRHYARPSFSGDERIFTDLASYAPGLNSSHADIQAVLEAEAQPRLSALTGKIDAAARTLIEHARAAGWQTMTIKNKDGKPVFAMNFDGRGRYSYERTLSSGLRERVVCDGTTLLHLYPELGLGARRTVSRFHRAELAALLPWVLPPAEDLAHGADVEALNAHTVAIGPRGASGAKTRDGKPVAFIRTHLIFGADNRLTEQRIVLMPENKTLTRTAYAADGTVKLFEEEDKEVATQKFALSPGSEPELKTDISDLVMLQLPFRTREEVYASLNLNPSQDLNEGENACYLYLSDEDALKLFVTDCAAQNANQARLVHRNVLLAHGQRKPGFYTLMTAAGATVSQWRDFRALHAEHPTPLLQYLTLLGQPIYQRFQDSGLLNLGESACESSDFLRPLAAFRDRRLIWRHLEVMSDLRPNEYRTEELRGLAFVRKYKDTPYAWALLGAMQSHASYSGDEFRRELADAWGLFADHPTLGYAARYERARNLLHGGRRDEARKLFREMFAEAVKRGVLPAIDGSFREALQGNPQDADLWTDMMRQTATEFVEKKQRPAVVLLAWQCWQLGDAPLAENLLTAALDGGDEEERIATSLAAVSYLRETSRYPAADALLRTLLANERLASRAWLWRLAASVGNEERAIECLERALDLEVHDQSEVVNLEEIRRDYGKLLDHYATLAHSAQLLKVAPPRDLVARTVLAADRWRAVDRDSETPCQRAASILRSLGVSDLAWEYLTTPIGQKPNESGPWQSLAQTLNREGEYSLSDRAYAAAFGAEPTNAQILWDRAQNLRQAGRFDEAQKVLKKIADGDWQPRFAWVRSQARWQLEGR